MGLIALAMFICFSSLVRRRNISVVGSAVLWELRWIVFGSVAPGGRRISDIFVISNISIISNSPSSVYLAPDVIVLGLFSGGLAPLGPESTGL